MDRGEVFGLRWKQIAFDNDQVDARRNKTLRARPLPLNDDLRAILSECQMGPRNLSGQVFLDKNGQPVEAQLSRFNSALKRAYKQRAKIAKGQPFKILRHTFGTRIANDPKNTIWEARDLMGHASVETTQRYVHTAPERLRAAMIRQSSGSALPRS